VRQHLTQSDRRRFLKTAAAGGLAGLSALAGCGSDQQPDDGGGTTTRSASGGETTGESETTSESETADSNAELGDPVPTYRYFNNPADYDPARHDAINLIASEMEKIGLDIEVQTFEWGTLLDKVYNQYNFDFATWNQGIGSDPGRRMREMFYSENADNPGAGNFSGYKNDRADEIITEQMRVSGEERKELLHELQEMITLACPMNAVTQMPDLMTYNNNHVSGWVKSSAGYNSFQNMTEIEVSNSENQLRGLWAESIQNLNPLTPTSSSYKQDYQFQVIYDKLVHLDSKFNPDPELSLASEWERPDEKSVIYTIPEGLNWHDGESLTAEDVAFTLKYIKEKEVSRFVTQWDLVDTVERNGNEVRVNFKNAVGPVHSLFSTQIHMLPKHIWKDVDNPAKRTVEAPVGSGPMQFDYWEKGSELGLKRFDEHWRPTNFQTRVWRIIPESSTVWELLKSGELHYIPLAQIGKQLADNRELSQISVESSPGSSWWHVTPNMRNEGLDRLAIRQAIVHSIPKTPITKQLLYGFAEPGWNLVSKMFGEFSNDDVKRYEEGIEPAKQRLEEDGYGWDDDGRLHYPAE